MPDRVILIEQFNRLLEASERATAECRQLAEAAEAPADRDRLERLARDGARRSELAERLVEIVSE